MLPVRLKTVSSSPCKLSDAASLLQRFLSSDACSDSFVRGYAASVAQALQESLPGNRTRRLHQVTSSEIKPLLPASPIPTQRDDENEGFHSGSTSRKDKKKRRRSYSVIASEDVTDERNAVQTAEEDVPDMQHGKKRRKKEKEKKGLQNHLLLESGGHSRAGFEDTIPARRNTEEVDHISLKLRSPDRKYLKNLDIFDATAELSVQAKSGKKDKKKDKRMVESQRIVAEDDHQSKAGKKEKKKGRNLLASE